MEQGKKAVKALAVFGVVVPEQKHVAEAAKGGRRLAGEEFLHGPDVALSRMRMLRWSSVIFISPMQKISSIAEDIME